MMDVLTYLDTQCRLRRNVLTGVLSYAPADSDDYLPLSREARNTLLLEAARQGVNLTEETLDRYVHSTRIYSYNPAEEWLKALPEWDGHDHVFDLSQRIVTSNPDWGKRFNKWMLQMVARWLGRDIAQRDLLVPVLVGQWGYGKTSFCNLLLPPVLRPYYTDQVHLKTSAEVYDLVTTNLLVCIDEFYQDHGDQQPAVRYLFSRSTPIFRQAYGTTVEPRHRMAAFIANTGNLHPMTDAAGAARLFCVEVGHQIDLATPIPYEQLYAQLMAQLEDGADTSLSEDEREAMAIQNSPFQEADNLVKMVSLLYAAPPKGKKAKAVYIDAIIDRLMKEYPYWTPGEHVNQDVGFALQEAGFTRSRIHGRSCYRIVPRDPRRLDFIAEPAEEDKKESVADNPLARALLAGLGGLAPQKP